MVLVAGTLASTVGLISLSAQEVRLPVPPLVETTPLAKSDTGSAQTPDPQEQAPTSQTRSTDRKPTTPDAPTPQITPSAGDQTEQGGKQPKRILYIVPNYRAVSANVQLPPATVKEKFWLATQDRKSVV